MHFSDIYQHEVVKSRRDRSRRALFWARITGLVLMLTIGATLRSEPELRQALMSAGMSAIADAPPTNTIDDQIVRDGTTTLRDKVKVNRFNNTPAVPDADKLADGSGQTLLNW